MKLLAFTMAFFIVGGLSGCDSPRQITGDAFLKELCQGQGARNSYWATEFGGVKDGNAYLHYWSAAPNSSAGGKEVHFVPLDQLPPGFSAGNPLASCQVPRQAPNNSFKPKPLRGSA